MSTGTKRVEGMAEEVVGNVKKHVGHAIGNEQMEAEGAVTELKGEARQAAAKAAEVTKGTVEKATGAIKETVGKVIGNQQMEAEGKARALVGEARVKVNK